MCNFLIKDFDIIIDRIDLQISKCFIALKAKSFDSMYSRTKFEDQYQISNA